MKDPTRGGLSGALNEMASKSGVGILVEETELPISPHTRAAADILGINLLDVANEGKVVMGVAPDLAEDVLHAVRLSTYGKDAQIIGTVQEAKRVFLSTEIGAKRLLDMPDGDPVPRVC
jgi:hydrogenase expression/formation protein HypE